MKILKSTSKEIRLLKEFLSLNVCRNGCAFEEMENSRKNCDKCEVPKLISSIEEKIDN